MLKNYRIVDEDSHKGAGAIIPGFGLVPLDADVLTDDMAKAAVDGGSLFFEEIQEKTTNTVVKGAKSIVETQTV
jgi:hypothetical protein